MPQGPTKIGSLRCSRAQPSVGKEDWVNGSIGCPTRQEPTSQRDDGTQGTMKRSGRVGEREAIVNRVSLAETRKQDEYIWRNEETAVKVRQVTGR